MAAPQDLGRVAAVLGPTNTGKTRYAIERMLAHADGMIGLPLRLLAREVYDKVVREKGAASAALITGEERIAPETARYFVCTAEAMPLDRRTSFLAVDEIQLCADPDRGHVFTHRLLHARGLHETLFLGADTMRGMVKRHIPQAEVLYRERLSTLSYSGHRKLTKLAKRTAIVAFSAEEVYAIAELIRRQRGGAAVVMGALSPRTRNAQVELYQSGEVDFLVATDAIGMGLNMDVDHVAFAGLRKFDGRAPRGLDATEIAQIAGRAGRHMNDGTFGTTADVPGIDADVVEAVENHAFQPLTALSWRNSELRFASVEALQACLERRPDQRGLIRAREADDQQALAILGRDADILALASHPERVKLLWDVCQIPDFRKVMADTHTRLLGQIFHHLCGPGRRLPADWLANHLARLDRVDGEMDTLLGRIAHVRTWTYVSHRADWVADPAHWQEKSRAIEDKLSDALHERLAQRFVDRRTSVLVRAMRDDSELSGAVAKSGEVLVEGQFVGHLDGFCFVADATEGAIAAKAVLAAAARSLKPEMAARVARLVGGPDDDLALDDHGRVLWRGQAVARLTAGHARLTPQVDLLPSDLLEPAQRDRLHKRLSAFAAAAIETAFARLRPPAEGMSGAGRGLMHQLAENLGSLPRPQARAQVAALTGEDRRLLARHDIRLGHHSVFVPALLKPAAQRLRGLLWAVHAGQSPPAVPPGRVSLAAHGLPDGFLAAIGYHVAGPLALRVDMLERVDAELRALARAHPDGFPLPPRLTSQLAAKPEQCAAALIALGWRPGAAGWRMAPRKTAAATARWPAKHAESSPFAVLLRGPQPNR